MTGAAGLGSSAALGDGMGSSVDSDPEFQARRSDCMAPMGPRSPRLHNPAHPGRPLLHLTTHSLGSHHKPGEATGSGSRLGVQNLSLPIQAYHLKFSPAGNQCRCRSGRRILGREPLSRWCLLGLIASLGKNKLLARSENHLLDCKKTVSTPQSSSPSP